jgi:fatty-acyl-CoA synthase
VFEDRRITFGELLERVQAAAGLLHAQGIRASDVVALLMKNSPGFLELALAVSHIGAVLLPLNFRLSAEEVDYIVTHAGAKLICVDEELLPSAGSLESRWVLDTASQRDTQCLAERLGLPVEPLRAGHPSDPDELFRLMYTSGTTDRPKGVMHSYANFYWKCLDHVIALELSSKDRLLVVGPLYHVGAFDLPGVAVLMMGGTLCLLRDFDPESVLSMIEREQVTCGWMAPVMLSRTLAYAGRDRFDVSSFRWLIGGGERTPEARIAEFGSLFRRGRYIDAYGLTESCSGDTLMEAGRELEKIGSTGRATPHVHIEIRDEEGRPLPSGSTGEVCLNGPKITKGYWRDPVKTAASFYPGGWFRTGDVGYLDAEGFLYLTDRKKDMIISGGENIASSEVERVLCQLTEIAEVAVIGIPDEKWGERVVAVVVLRSGATLDEATMQAKCRMSLAAFKVPKQLIIVDELPRNPSGKVLKRILRGDLTAPNR